MIKSFIQPAPGRLRTYLFPHSPKIENGDSSVQRTGLHFSLLQLLCFFAKSNRESNQNLIVIVTCGFSLATRLVKFAART